MKTGAIADVVEYYSNNPNYKIGFNKAICDFFDYSVEGVLECKYLDDWNIKILFNEWFLFDFKISDNKTPLEIFYENNPLNYSFSDIELYKNLQNNECGFFCIISSKPGRVEIESLQQKKIYLIREYAAATDLKPSNTIAARIVWTGERYEFISINGVFNLQMVASAKQFYRNLRREKITAKDIYQILYNEDAGEEDNLICEDEEEGMTPQKAKEQAEEALKRCELLDFVSIEKLKKWIYEKEKNNQASFPLTVLFGLIPPDIKEEDAKFLIKTITNLINYSPHKVLDGKSPSEMPNESKEKGEGEKSTFIKSVVDLGLYIKFANKTIDAIRY